jgi:MraZ protein
MDAKGRVTLPTEFRTLLGDDLYLVEGSKKCVRVYPAKTYLKLEDTLDDDQINPDMDTLLYQIVASATPAGFDSVSRVRIPESLRDHANLYDKEIAVVGMIRYIEIWNKNEWLHFKKGLNPDEAARELNKRSAG